MPDEITPDRLDELTVRLIFALRDSNEHVEPRDFWNDRVQTAIETAAAGSDNIHQAVTYAARKLQIVGLTRHAAETVVAVAAELDGHYQQWSAHVADTAIYIVALARVANADAKAAKKKPQAETPASNSALPF